MKQFLIYLIFLFIIFSCSSEYQKLEKKELSRGIREDSLFQGLYLGMDRQSFFDHCLTKNHERIFKDGILGKIEYKIDELPFPATMFFYPEFKTNKIFKVPATIQYDGWAPWNKELQADKLVEQVIVLLMHWHKGNPFVKIESESKPTIWVKVDGNRRIILFISSEGQVSIIYRDLLVVSDDL
mgnify:FL=1